MRSRPFARGALLVLAAAACSVVLAGQALPKLPPDVTLAGSPGSPGPVVFSHQSHVAVQAKPDCTVCHPALAPILHEARRQPITHARMEKGQACGACHNGRDAHGFDDCTTCHTAQ